MEEQNLTPQPEVETAPQNVEVVDIQFRPGQKVYFFDPAGLTLKQGDHVIIDTARGPEYGICAGGNHTVTSRDVVAPLRSVLRLATPIDEKIVAENRQKEKNKNNHTCQNSKQDNHTSFCFGFIFSHLDCFTTT